MSTVRVPARMFPRPQVGSYLFRRMTTELRVLIFKFVFLSLSCEATAWFDGEFAVNEGSAHGGRKAKQFKSGACCFTHSGGGFGILMTCRLVYFQAPGAYWEHVTLKVARSIEEKPTPCGLISVCKYLPAAIKANLGDLRNIKLPLLEVVRSTPDDPTWTPALLRQFPKLKILECSSYVLFGMSASKDFTLNIPDHPAQFYSGLGPFKIGRGEMGEIPAQYIERKIGVQLSGGLVMLSKERVDPGLYSPPGWKRRWRYLNWTTGMMYQTTNSLDQWVRGYLEVLEAEPGYQWSRWYCLPPDAARRAFAMNHV